MTNASRYRFLHLAFFALSAYALIAFGGIGHHAFAQEPVSASYFGDIAIGSHDSVAYHQNDEGEHVAWQGDETFTVSWKGAEWRFSSKKNRDAFAAEPERFSPAYNGHCANALSLGEGLIETDGSHWEIFDDQLYLFYAARGRTRWLAVSDYRQYKAQADAAWAEIVGD